MLPAVLTTILWALSTLFAQRSIKAVGSTRANLGRLGFSFVVLGIIAHLFGNGMSGSGRDWLLLSGVIGMGLGDLAFFAALPLLGSRITILIGQCLAAPIAALVEWLWLGTALTGLQLGLGLLILAGIVFALAPSKSNPPRVKVRPIGFLFGAAAAAGQGIGAVISRKANLTAQLSGEHIDGFTAAYQRIAGGLLITVAYFALKALLEKRNLAPASITASEPIRTWKSYLWIPINASCGAILGVSCYQWALFSTPSAIVLPIVATTPLVIIPLAFWLEKERPSRRSLVGALIAVSGAVGLALVK
jgi:drug/metabolite transporter (DMT)-like permease